MKADLGKYPWITNMKLGKAGDLISLIEETDIEYQAQDFEIDVVDFMKLDLPPRSCLMSPWLPEKSLAMIYGPRGAGKTYFAQGIAHALVTGTDFLSGRWVTGHPASVLIIDGEMPEEELQRRFKERYGEDKQKMQQAMMEMYKKDKVNPMGGCFPLLLQMQIFLALYWVLLESVELRHADFIFWITDLSAKDPFFVLPVLTGLSMYLLQKLQPMTMTDPMQQKIMMFMPVMFTFFFLWAPSGLVIYWLTSNLFGIGQQLVTNRIIGQPTARAVRPPAEGRVKNKKGSAEKADNSIEPK